MYDIYLKCFQTMLTFRLKAQLREITLALKAKDAEIELLRRNIRSTRLEEAEQMNKAMMEESTRLREMLET